MSCKSLYVVYLFYKAVYVWVFYIRYLTFVIYCHESNYHRLIIFLRYVVCQYSGSAALDVSFGCYCHSDLIDSVAKRFALKGILTHRVKETLIVIHERLVLLDQRFCASFKLRKISEIYILFLKRLRALGSSFPVCCASFNSLKARERLSCSITCWRIVSAATSSRSSLSVKALRIDFGWLLNRAQRASVGLIVCISGVDNATAISFCICSWNLKNEP